MPGLAHPDRCVAVIIGGSNPELVDVAGMAGSGHDIVPDTRGNGGT